MHIGIFGRRNVGKSSLMNAITGQDVAIVSDIPGTTTDVVKKAMELKPIGPVLFLDTAGLDDAGELGKRRIQRSLKAMDRTDIALLLTDDEIREFEIETLDELKKLEIPVIIVFSKSDLHKPSEDSVKKANEYSKHVISASLADKSSIAQIRNALVELSPEDFINPSGILTGLVNPGDVVILVVPIDMEAPKGRLILPQVQVLREVLDLDARAVVVKESELPDALNMLKEKPKIVITDSQAILKVVGDVPDDIPVTGFSVLFARWKGDLETFINGTFAIADLKQGDRILIGEACTHHPVEDDIGRVKIPKWMQKYVGGVLDFKHYAGHDFPDDLSSYKLAVLCGSCMINRREVLTRLLRAKEAGVPVSNYGLTIAFSLGVLERMLSPFPGLLEKCKSVK